MKKINKKILGFVMLLGVMLSVLSGCTDYDYAVYVPEETTQAGEIDLTEKPVQTVDTTQSEVTEQAAQSVEIQPAETVPSDTTAFETQPAIDENGTYTSKEDVALYIHTFSHLPSNYITKKEAQNAGWKDKGTLDKLCPGKSIGGDKFGNYEGLLPSASGRQYYECDIDYVKGNRNSKRIIYSNDGLIYYTEDHYSTFTQLY